MKQDVALRIYIAIVTGFFVAVVLACRPTLMTLPLTPLVQTFELVLIPATILATVICIMCIFSVVNYFFTGDILI